MLFIQKRKVSAEPSGDVGARRYQATRSVKQPLANTQLSGRLDSARCQRIDLLEAFEVRVAQKDRPNGVGNIAISILAGKLQALGVVRVHFQGHISRGRSRLHSLVILKPGLHPAVVQLLRWLVQNQLEVDFGSPVLSNQLDKAGSSFPLSPKALAGLANPASTSHSSLFRLQFTGTDTAEDEPAIGAAPKGMDSTVAIVAPACTWGCRWRPHFPRRARGTYRCPKLP